LLSLERSFIQIGLLMRCLC